MSNNFKDDFEKNRQSIDTNSHQDHIEDVEKDQAEVEHQDTSEKTEQQFPPRNAQRRKRRRDLATNHNKQDHHESKVSEDKVQNEAGTLDDRQDEASLHSSSNQEVSHHESKSHNEESNYFKNTFAMDKSHPEPNEEKVKHEETQEAQVTEKDQSVANNVDHEKVQQPKPHFATDTNKPKESAENSKDVPVDAKNDDTKEKHNGKKAAAIGAGTAGVAGAAGGASKAKYQGKDQQNVQKDSVDKATQSNEAKQKEKDQNSKKGAAVGAGTAGVVGAAAASKQQASAQTNHHHEHRNHQDKEKEHKKGGMTKVLLPLIAAVLIVGALAIFGGMALNNHNNGTKENKIANTNKNKSEDSKDKKSSTDSAKDKSKSEDNDKSKSDDKDKATTDDQNNVNQANNQTQNNQNQQQANQNQQQQRQGGGQRHTVSGQENLYRIAIQYYGSGSPENVEKIRRANGLSGNNIRNGQQIIIP
ncbi:elastin-binding protein EbpS [Staphylococcus sp. 30400_3112M30941]|nr:elastin-binding protein EbpS [Staphylococcus sp. 30403_3112M30944]MBO0946239.1 elastin-binding protein EbpS [Staphylococcus sp. 30402_3112M30943]MBO0963011.1 elastin-binding protein EbpS [Staphylococcus sp. 30400_3112M30941]MBO0966176.1 elastin-binding protein EbpS [Staphylococcus sp. 30401_3112M30942]